MMWDWNHWGGAWMIVMMVLMVLFWGGIIALIVWAISRLTRRASKSESQMVKSNPLDIAKERYAKGEITKEQYEQIKKDLG